MRAAAATFNEENWKPINPISNTIRDSEVSVKRPRFLSTMQCLMQK